MVVRSASLPHPHSSTDDEDGGLICLQPHSLDRTCTSLTPSDSRDLLKKAVFPYLPL